MNIWRRIRQMSIPQLFRFGLLFVTNPFLIAPTIRASKYTVKICDARFGKMAHHGNGKANAFRHALWNFEICRFCQKWLKNDRKSSKWAKKVTDLYEKVTKNEPLDVAMDLHNNRIGREQFLVGFSENMMENVEKLLKMTENAINIARIEEISADEDQLVYISE
ncbi:hypothetical protein J1N09_00055 [Aureitalea sp. L0-47]|uniref:DUF6973 domain-containing protein n=1 Tax=Aureitalea sp. L0-47 TaxID=2816962 RepID=UPI002236F9D7|nr:hypothetical protein [Aureitalea sp. L0-47]MCW5518209.1 hypothetical protein [Aureitalea sp. L0-47]